MTNEEYANAYTEVLEILKYIPNEDYSKLPKEKIEFYKLNMNMNYHFNYDPKKTLQEQNVSKVARMIVAKLFRDYWATQEQKVKIEAFQKQERNSLEKEKQEKYKSDIFKTEINKDTVESSLIEKKEFIINKLIKWVKNNLLKK